MRRDMVQPLRFLLQERGERCNITPAGSSSANLQEVAGLAGQFRRLV